MCGGGGGGAASIFGSRKKLRSGTGKQPGALSLYDLVDFFQIE